MEEYTCKRCAATEQAYLGARELLRASLLQLADKSAKIEEQETRDKLIVKALKAVMEIYPGDDAVCYYDHHGYCQAHNLAEKGSCHVELVIAAINLVVS